MRSGEGHDIMMVVVVVVVVVVVGGGHKDGRGMSHKSI